MEAAFSWPRIPFALHITVETAAAASFILRPESQLPRTASSSTAAQLVLQSLGGLLLSTNLICVVFVARPDFDETSRLVAASLAFWHGWACRRAWVRMTRDVDVDVEVEENDTRKKVVKAQRSGNTFGGPAVHFGVHSLLLGSLLGVAWFG